MIINAELNISFNNDQVLETRIRWFEMFDKCLLFFRPIGEKNVIDCNIHIGYHNLTGKYERVSKIAVIVTYDSLDKEEWQGNLPLSCPEEEEIFSSTSCPVDDLKKCYVAGKYYALLHYLK